MSLCPHDMGDNTKFLRVLEQANAISYMKELWKIRSARQMQGNIIN